MSNTVFVRNLPYGTTQQQLEELFGDIGPVKKVSVIKDKGRAKTDMTTRGFAFVKFAMDADAQLAIEKLNNSDYQGRKLCIDIAKEKRGPKPLAHQKPRVEENDTTADDQPTQEDKQEDVPEETSEKEAKKEKKEKKKAKQEESAEEAVPEAPSKKEKKAKKHAREEEEVEEVEKQEKKAKKRAKQEDDEAEVEVVAKKQEKKSKKKSKEEKDEKQEAEDAPEEETPKDKTEKKSKKRKLDETASAASEPKTQANKNEDTQESEHVQSERNARRRQHRELLRQMKERKEKSASSEEKSIVIYGLGSSITEKMLKIKMKKIGQANKIEWKEDQVNGTTQHVAIVEWDALATKEKALEKLNNHVFKGFTMTVRGLESTTTGISQKEGVRLIVRNLQFDVKDADLEKLFGAHGPLAEVRVVRMPVENQNVEEGAKAPLGRSRGFGFVQFKSKVDAQRAIEALNNTKLKGREIVVDYALSKAEYLKAQANTPAEESAEAEEKKEEEGEENQDENGGEDDEGDEEEGEDAPELDDDENTLEMEDDGEEGEEDDEDDEDEEEDEAPSKPKVDTESQRERTVFIRNLSFQTTEEGLAESFTNEFGPVEYARIVMDKGSGLSKGVAFVRFRSKEAADEAISRGSVGSDDKKKDKKSSSVSGGLFYNSAMLDGDGVYVDGRLLSITRSVAKDDADRMTEENSAKRKAVDKRNMYLAYEGTINVNKASETELELPKMDIEKRRRAIKEKKEKLKNPLFFISPVRLSVRNLALSVDEKTLKQVFREAAAAGMKEKLINMKDIKLEYQLKKDVPVKIILCKIVRDTENLKPGQEPRSRGYGFVEFSQHVHALAALRKLNNNPAYTQYSGRGINPGRSVQDKDKTRLIIEFALENHGKLKLREKRMNDAKKRREEEAMLRKAQGEVEEKPKEKKSRGKRQREAKAQRAKEPETKSEEPPAKKPKVVKPKAPAKPKQQAVKPVKAVAQKSRQQRKSERAQKEEKSFDEMVDSYKKKLFSTVEDSEARGRWFD